MCGLVIPNSKKSFVGAASRYGRPSGGSAEGDAGASVKRATKSAFLNNLQRSVGLRFPKSPSFCTAVNLRLRRTFGLSGRWSSSWVAMVAQDACTRSVRCQESEFERFTRTVPNESQTGTAHPPNQTPAERPPSPPVYTLATPNMAEGPRSFPRLNPDSGLLTALADDNFSKASATNERMSAHNHVHGHTYTHSLPPA